jgi:hypothetical protein
MTIDLLEAALFAMKDHINEAIDEEEPPYAQAVGIARQCHLWAQWFDKAAEVLDIADVKRPARKPPRKPKRKNGSAQVAASAETPTHTVRNLLEKEGA